MVKTPISNYISDERVEKALLKEIRAQKLAEPFRASLFKWSQQFVAQVMAGNYSYSLEDLRSFLATKYPRLFE